MPKNISLLAPLVLLVLAPSSRAGWYEVNNYAGTVGTAHVHVSLQTFGHIAHGDPGEWQVEGSYYYDAHRIPIPLEGQRKPDGSMVLCEAALPRLSTDSPVVPASSTAHPVPCPIALKVAEKGASGEWNDGTKKVPIELHQVGSLDDTGRAANPLTGVVEIPMWHHTKTHLLLGVYQSSEHCPVSMRHLRLVDIATGRVDDQLPLACAAGTLMTPIYANVSRGRRAHQVTVKFGGGKMGSEEVFDIEPRVKGR